MARYHTISLCRKFLLILLVLISSLIGARSADFLPPGHRPKPLGIHALIKATVVPLPGQSLKNATILIRDGKIEAVGTKVSIPPDARVHDLSGCIVYAGFIDPALSLTGSTNSPLSTSHTEPILTSGAINFFGVPGQEADPGKPGPGYELSRITPEHREAESYHAKSKALEGFRELGFTAGNVIPENGIIRGTSVFVQLNNGDPNDAVLRPDVFEHIVFDPTTKNDSYPGSLMGVIAAIRQTFFDAQHYALAKADGSPAHHEFNPALEALQPVITKKIPVLFEPGSALMVDRAKYVAQELKLDYVIYSCGQEWRRPDLAAATGATFIVPLNFPAAPKLPTDDDWIDVTLDQLRTWDWAPENAAVLRQQGREVALTTRELADKKSFRKNAQQAIQRGLTEKDALAALTTVPAKICGVDQMLGTIEAGKLANLTVVKGADYFNPDDFVQEVWIEGERFPNTPPAGNDQKAKAKGKSAKKPAAKKENLARVARIPTEDQTVLARPQSILVRNATIWTCGPQGILTNASLLISDGKVQEMGSFKVELSADTLVIDAQGKHITPGLIDAHSHSMILGDVNEGTLPSTAMVRIGDVVNSETENIYKQLAGGLTVANLLHGSANPIGGQTQIIKLKNGASPEGLKFPDAPPGIKFALGENVKQSNWGEDKNKRFPQTRMGVPTFMANRFLAAQQYLAEWDRYRQNGGLPPKRNLELEAIGEILQGKRWIHCHCYRQDEILVFLRTMESFHVTVGTLQHVLEGYKVADEIAKHGVGGSCFSDWWGYKFEVYDAIPYDGSLMRERGVLVSFNSDSSDLARRLYLEAAKAVRYGGTAEVEALKFVTLNPAKQLRIDGHVGSLEKGKDGDFVLWSKSPLDAGTLCLETWIDGQKYFDISLDGARTERRVKERAALIAKARKMAEGSKASEAAKAAFFKPVLETMYELLPVRCLDCERHGGQP